MNLKDIIELAKQGYTPNDIKELIAMSTTEGETKTELDAVEEVPAPTIEIDVPAEEKKTDIPAVSEESSIDYKKLYEESQAQLRESQKLNINRNIEANSYEDGLKHLKESIRGFM